MSSSTLLSRASGSRFVLHRLAAMLSVALVAFVLSSQAAAQDATDAAIRARLEAGEFGPARALAEAAKNPALRDNWLRQIALAQAGVGIRNASIFTASDINSDLIRSQALSGISSQPLGGDRWGRGGAAMADFDSLIELIKTTVAPDSWEDAGGAGSIAPFEGGVYVNSTGLLNRLVFDSGGRSLAALRNAAAADTGNTDVRKKSALRKVSLTRLEKQVQLLAATGREPSEVMNALAGIHRIKYVLVYPDTGDIVIAGPAGDWTVNHEGRRVNSETGLPVLNLDDLVVCLRNAYEEHGRFGCTIDPRKENLADTKQFLAESKLTGAAWRTKLRETLGKQDIHVYGIDPQSRAARVMVEADYRMKLVGMGLEEGTLGVSSYLDSVELGPDGNPPPSDVVRWWFTLNYDAVRATEAHDAFEIHGQGVKVLSEKELLTERGERVHTGKTDGPAREFAHSFTKHFDVLAAKYPVYAELRNVFDLALLTALMRAEDLPGQVDWHMTHFGPAKDDQSVRYQVELDTAAKEVDSVMNHRSIKRGNVIHTVVGVSGGVSVDTGQLVSRDAIKTDDYGLMKADRTASTPKNLPRDAWWWD